MASFPSTVATKPAGIIDGSAILDDHVDDGWDEIIAIQNELLGGGSGAFIVDVRPAAAGNLILRTRQKTADTQNRFQLSGQGRMDWGTGAAVPDTALLRSAAHTLSLLGSLQTQVQANTEIGLEVRGAASQSADLVRVTGNAGTPTYLSLTSAGQLVLPVTGATGGLLVGGDAALYRGAADTWTTPDSLQVGGTTLALTGGASLLALRSATAATTQVLGARAAADGNDRFTLRADGQHAWGAGGIGVDTTLTRTNPNELTLSGTLICGAIQSASQLIGGDLTLGAPNGIIGTLGTAAVTNKLRTSVAGDTQDRFQLRADGQHNWGSGSVASDISLLYASPAQLRLTGGLRVQGTLELGATGDVSLTRSAADTLATPDSLDLGGTLTLTGAASQVLARAQSAATNVVLGTRATGDTVDRLAVRANGAHEWGPGSGAADVTLNRIGTGLIKLTGHLEMAATSQVRADAGTVGAPGYSFAPSLSSGLLYVASGPQRVSVSVNGSVNNYFTNIGMATGILWPAGSRLNLAGGASGGTHTGGVVEAWHSLSVSNAHGFGAFPDPTPGGLYVDQKLYLGSLSDVWLQRTAAGDIGLERTTGKTRLRLKRPDNTPVYLEVDNSNQLLVSLT